jgi:hypothetical protein
MNIYGTPSCTFAEFAGHLAAHGSLAAVEALAIWTVLTSKRVDPAVALGFFHHESSCGTRGRALVTRSWGNLRYKSIYGTLTYPVRDVDGFAAYQTFTTAARHFADHLLGKDGTDNYTGLGTVELVVPVWAPVADGNAPVAYIQAVEDFVYQIGGKILAKPRILHIAGHLRTQNITEEGLCDGLDKAASAAALRGMTGTTGEQDFTANMSQKQADDMNATGVLEARAIDCTYHAADYVDWKPNLVIAHHIHRDGSNRAMFAVPDNTFKYHSDTANQESIRFMARVIGGYTAKTGIPITQDAVTLRMRQLYTWCYIDNDSQAFIPEYGNGNLDTAALFNADSVLKIVKYFTACVMEHFNVGAVQPQPTPTPVPAPIPQPVPDKLAQAKSLARQIVDL